MVSLATNGFALIEYQWATDGNLNEGGRQSTRREGVISTHGCMGLHGISKGILYCRHWIFHLLRRRPNPSLQVDETECLLTAVATRVHCRI